MHYHHGGINKVMEGAGRDCTVLFNKYHKWVNCDSMLAGCLVGYIGDSTNSSIAEGNEDVDDNSLNEAALKSLNSNDA